MNVTLITKNYPPVEGGISDVSFRWVQEMEKIPEFNIYVITSLMSAENINTMTTNWGFLDIRKIYKVCIKNQSDIIIFNYEPHMLNMRGWPSVDIILIFILACRFKLILSVHELYVSKNINLIQKIKSFYQKSALSLALYHSRIAVVTTEDRLKIISQIAKNRGRKNYLIPNGSIFNSHSGKKNVKKDEDDIKILFFGSSHPDKGSDIVKFMSEKEEFRGKIFSIGSKMGAGVTDMGFIPYKELSTKMMEFDIVILPFLDGASGRRSSFINSISLGLPVVTTYGINSPAHLKGSGVPYVSVEKVGDFPDKVRMLLGSPTKRAEAANASKELYMEYYSWEKICKAWEELIIQIGREPKDG